MDEGDVLELVKIAVILIFGYIIVKALLSIDSEPNHIKCACDCYDYCKNVIHLG